MATLSSIRAFVSGESYWSKSQKEAVHLLHVYAETHDNVTYERFLQEISVPLSDQSARLELQKKSPNLKIAAQALIRGKNSPEDINGVISVFLMFHRTSLLKPAIQYWEQGDQLISQMLQVAQQIHRKVQSGEASQQELDLLLKQVDTINAELRPIADGFSDALGEASRAAQRLIAITMLIMTGMLTALGIGFTRKIIIRNQASAKALQRSEERWKFALEGAKDGVWDWNLQTNTILVSRPWHSMLGYEDAPLESTYQQWEQRVHPEDLPKVLHALEAYIQGDAAQYALEHRLRCQSGQYKWVLTRGMIVDRAEDGSPLRMVGTHTDIDQQKQIEASLRESDANQRALLEAMVDGVFVAQDYRFVFTNPILPEMLGYTQEEFINMPFEQVIAPEWLSLWEERFAARIQGDDEPPKNYQVNFLHKHSKDTLLLDLHASRVIFRGKPGVLGILRDITQQKLAEDLIWHQANFDGLTALPNRNMFLNRLQDEIHQSARTNTNLAVMFLDLDRFKEVNDSLGHDVGDKLLQETALRLLECVRDTDTVARLGGDEFVLLLTDVQDKSTLERISKTILQKLSAPFNLGVEPIYISASIGITLYPKDAENFEDLLKNADQAMYAAKTKGRNRFSYFTPSMQAAVQLKMRLANDLRQALVRGEFQLMYQPIVEVMTSKIRKAEALLRWHHPTRGLISPAEFISVAEETGLIMELGEWVFKEAIQQLIKWRGFVDEDFQMSINKSPAQFKQPHSNWVDYMHHVGLSGKNLVIEITESLLLEASDNVGKQLLEFRDAGIHVAIDDFGTGYSSLAYLKEFDIDFIKIDQSFIINLCDGNNDMGLCEAITLMAHKLGMKVIAEGVETEAQFQLLAKVGCDYIQGYLIGRPLSADDFERLVSRTK